MDIEKDLLYLAQTDETHAELTANCEAMKDGEKHTKGKYVSESSKAVSKAEHEYYASPDFIEIMKLRKEGNKSLKALTNKRQTSILRIEVWRTLEASRRKGNIN